MYYHLPISIIIPLYNEVDNVRPFMTEVHEALKEKVITYEIIAIDDGSSDGTDKQLTALLDDIPTLHIVTHLYNAGQSTAILSGVRAAQYAWIITMDGDAQNDPHDIPLLLDVLIQSTSAQPLLIAGNRKKRHDSMIRQYSSRIANRVRHMMLKDHCIDTGCSLKLLSRDLFLQLPHFNHMHRYLPSLIKRAGGCTINVPVNHRPRTRGKSKYGIHNRLWVGIVDLCGVKWLMKRTCNPIIKYNKPQIKLQNERRH